MHPNQGGPHAGQGQGPTVHHIRAQTRQDVGASTTHTAGASTTLLSCLHALAHRVSPSAACPPYRAASDHARVAQSLGASCASQRTGGTARLAGVPRIGQDRGRRWACRRDAGGGSTDSTSRKHASVDGSRAARKHAHPACAQAHKAASRPHHAPVGRSHPPLEATVSPVPAAVGRSSTGAPLPLIHDRPASRGTVRPHTCAGPKPVTCSHNPTLPPSPPRRPTAAHSCALPSRGERPLAFVHKENQFGGQGGGARTGTDGHDRHEHHTPSTDKNQVQSGQTRGECKAQAAHITGRAAPERRDQGGRASPLSHAQSAGARCQGAGPPRTRAGSRARGTAHAPHGAAPGPPG